MPHDPIAAYRYKGGVLVLCQDVGASFRELLPGPPPLDAILADVRAEAPVADHGIAALDRRREQKRSGVPAWWEPLLSRRKRCVTWAAACRALRAKQPGTRYRPFPPHQALDLAAKTRLFEGHRIVCWRAVAHRPGAREMLWEALLYLPAGEHPTAQHQRDVAEVVQGRRPLTAADVRARIDVWLLDDAAVAAEVERANAERPCRDVLGIERAVEQIVFEARARRGPWAFSPP